MSGSPPPAPDVLRRLARRAGVADRYEAGGRTHTPPDRTLRSVLTALGHPCTDEATAAASLRALRRRRWIEAVDPVAVVWGDADDPTTVPVSAADGTKPTIRLALEDGGDRDIAAPVWGGIADVGDGRRRRGSVTLPTDLPVGYHRLTVDDGDRTGACTVIVAPPACPDPGDARRWGWMVQTYAVRSTASWGQGEFRDLADLAVWSAGHGADFVLTNPVHAAAPVTPRQPSPYSPTSRRFADPAYLHVPDMPEFAELRGDVRDDLQRLPPGLAADTDRIDRDLVWRTKRAAFDTLYTAMSDRRRDRLAEFRRTQGTSLQRFAVFCALAEAHGLPWHDWPDGLTDPDGPAVARWADEHADEVALHAWLQLSCREQLLAAQERARGAGMAIGVIHDLAVGVDPDGADAWALPDQLAHDARVGAPPDAFNQQGQDWAQPPLLPGALRRTGYRTLRELLAASLAVGGGLRIDHILGLSRLFWIPTGATPSDGTYVRYPADEMFAVLAVEAERAGAIVIGEDLGTVDSRIRQLMRRRGVAGSAVLYFERDDDGGLRPAARYPRRALASVTTHDLPTATGWWDGSAVETRVDLGVVDDAGQARHDLADDQRAMLDLLTSHGCLDDPDAGVRERVLAMHRFLASTPSLLVAGAIWDAVGDARQPNVPGTVDEYPNWRLPLAEPTATGERPTTLDELRRSPNVADVIGSLRRDDMDHRTGDLY